MHNRIYRKNVIRNRVSASLYIITLLIFEIIALALIFKYAPDSTFLMVVFVISAAIIHSVLYLLVTLYVDKRQDKLVSKTQLISVPIGRFPRARPQPLPSLRSVQGLQLALFPLESPISTSINARIERKSLLPCPLGTEINMG